MNSYTTLRLSRSMAFFAGSLLAIGGAFSQSVCLSVQQKSEKISSLGTACHPLSDDAITIECEGDKAIVKKKTTEVASLPCSDGGALVVTLSDDSEDSSLSCTIGSEGYATLYSPFQLTVPEESGVEVYAPTYVDGKLMLTDETRLVAGTVVPPETGLILKNEGNVTFPFTSLASSSVSSALSGSSLVITVPSATNQTIYTLGYATDDASLYGFYKYVGSTLQAGKAYLLATDVQSLAQVFVPFSFGDELTGISDASTSSFSSLLNGKFLEKGQVVVVKNGKKYQVSGRRIR